MIKVRLMGLPEDLEKIYEIMRKCPELRTERYSGILNIKNSDVYKRVLFEVYLKEK